MRVIQTEMYLDPAEIEGREPQYDNPGVAVAWFRSESHDFVDLRRLEQFRPVTEHAESQVENFLSLCVQGAAGERAIGLLNTASIPNRHIVNYLLEQPIVIEQSPPLAVPFKDLVSAIGKQPHILIGTYIGVNIAGGNPLIMLVSVPGGIIVVGSAIAVSKALEKGINKAFEKLFKRLLR